MAEELEKKTGLFNSLLSKNGNSMSSIRFVLLLSVILSNSVIFLIWLVLSLINMTMVDIPESVLYLYALANGLSLTGKVVQRQIELKEKPVAV
jgi:hypothetical protein